MSTSVSHVPSSPAPSSASASASASSDDSKRQAGADTIANMVLASLADDLANIELNNGKMQSLLSQLIDQAKTSPVKKATRVSESKTKSPVAGDQQPRKISNALLFFKFMLRTDENQWKYYTERFSASYKSALDVPAVAKKLATKDTDVAGFRAAVAGVLWTSLPDDDKATIRSELVQYNQSLAAGTAPGAAPSTSEETAF